MLFNRGMSGFLNHLLLHLHGRESKTEYSTVKVNTELYSAKLTFIYNNTGYSKPQDCSLYWWPNCFNQAFHFAAPSIINFRLPVDSLHRREIDDLCFAGSQTKHKKYARTSRTACFE